MRLTELLPQTRSVEAYRYVLVYFLPQPSFSPLNLPRMGESRQAFLNESLTDLNTQAQAHGSRLCVFREAPEKKLVELAHLFQAKEVLIPVEPGTEEAQQTKKVQQALNKAEIDWYTYDVSYLIDASYYNQRALPMHFTDFRKEVERAQAFHEPNNAVVPLLPLNYTLLDEVEVPALTRPSNLFQGGRTAALQRLRYYFEETQLPSTYKETRNESLGLDYSTKFSAWLSLGCITPSEIHQALHAYERIHGANESTYWIQFELVWRDFFRLSAGQFGAKLFLLGGVKSYNQPVRFDEAIFEQWRTGQTESDFVNAHMRELLETGFMSNRGRQNVASYWIHELQQDWRVGAYWFEHQLLDYDVASNWGNWAYIAGVGSDPRGGRKFSIEKQAATYDPAGAHRKHWLQYATQY